METTNTINMIRNVSKTDEMAMTSGRYSLRAEITVMDGKISAINNGTVVEMGTQIYLGSFVAYGSGSVNVNLQNVTSRETRGEIYEAVENFLGAVTAKIENNTDEKG